MSRIVLTLACLALLFGFAAPAAAFSVSIQGPSNVYVPYGGCTWANWSAWSSSPISTYDWTLDGLRVSTSSGHSELYCSPGLDWYSADNHTIALYATSNGYGDYDSLGFAVHYEGRCGTEIIC